MGEDWEDFDLPGSSERVKVIICGFPMWVEFREGADEIPTIGGFWSFLLDYLPFTGVMLEYEGSYLKGLWHWMFG